MPAGLQSQNQTNCTHKLERAERVAAPRTAGAGEAAAGRSGRLGGRIRTRRPPEARGAPSQRVCTRVGGRAEALGCARGLCGGYRARTTTGFVLALDGGNDVTVAS